MNEKQQQKIKQEDLLLEITIALKEVFVAQIEKEKKGITMQFPSGQKFILAVIEEE